MKEGALASFTLYDAYNTINDDRTEVITKIFNAK